MNKRVSFAIWVIIVGVFCICFLGGFFLTWKLVKTNQTVMPTTPIQLNPSVSKNEEEYEIATTDIDGKLVLGDISTGKIIVLDIAPLAYMWSPDSKWLAATNYEEAWLISAQDGSTQQIAPDSKGSIRWTSWSPDSTLLVFWANSEGTGLGLQVYDLRSKSYKTIPGTESYDCEIGTPAWSFDEEWIIFHAETCNSSLEKGDVVSMRIDGAEKKILHDMFYSIVSFPSSTDHRVAFNTFNIESSIWELYLSDFRSLDSSVTQIKDYEGRQLFGAKWSIDGNGFYSMPFNWGHPELDFVDSRTGKIKVIWSDTDDTHYPGDIWSPEGTKIVNRYKGLIIFDIATGTFSEWKEGLSNVCGIQWGQDDEVVAVVVCEASGELPVAEMSIISNDGTKIRLGDDLYGGVVEISSLQP